jgi:hypothetical protein
MAEVESIDRILTVREHSPSASLPVADRVLALLGANPEMTFSPCEIMEAVHAGEESVRKVLTRLAGEGRVRRVAHATYQANSDGYGIDEHTKERLTRKNEE